jgi:hypothetical protein
LADAQGGIQSHASMPAHPTKREARLEQYFEQLTKSFLNQVAAGMLNPLGEVETVKRKDELQSIYREAGKLSIQLWKQTTQPCVDIACSLKEQFSIRSVSMQPHSSMLLDEDDFSCDGKLPDMIIEPGLFAIGDANNENYDMRKNWMKATVLLFNQPPEQYPKTLKQAEVPKLTNLIGQASEKHRIKLEQDENETHVKRVKKDVPSGKVGDNAAGQVRQAAASIRSNPGPYDPEANNLHADTKAIHQKTSMIDGNRSKERYRSQTVAGVAQRLSNPNLAKQVAESKPANQVQRSTITSEIPRQPASASLRAAMGDQSSIPQMSVFSKTLADLAEPKPRNDAWEKQDSKTSEATAIQILADDCAARRRAQPTPIDNYHKKPAGLYHGNATRTGATQPENPTSMGGSYNGYEELTKGEKSEAQRGQCEEQISTRKYPWQTI